MAKGRDKQGREVKKKPKAKTDKVAPPVSFQHHPTPAPKPAPSGSSEQA